MYRTRKFHKKTTVMETYLNNILYIILICVVIPIFITTFSGKLEVERLILKKPTLKWSKIEETLPGVVAKQISIDMPDEAIKAQCIIARTQLMTADEKGENAPASFTRSELQELWGEQYEDFYQKIEGFVEETSGQTLKYNGNLIYAAYHQASAGNTRDMKEYYENSRMPYLKGAVCHEDTMSNRYLNVFFWTKEEFIALCENSFPEEIIVGGTDVSILKRDSAGYVLEVKVGQTIYEGEKFRKLLNLPSSYLEITMLDEDVRIVTMGQGHGFGMSQHMAGRLAEEGKNYIEILEYFYDGVEIVNLNL